MTFASTSPEKLQENIAQHDESKALHSLDRLLRRDGLYGLGQAYLRGEIVTANLEDLITQAIRQPQRLPRKWNLRIITQLLRNLLFNPQIGDGAYVVGKRHYDLGNDLFTAMLDQSMSYTCGVWRTAETLEQAQTAKLELICQKLQLRPKMTVLDIGCGWGNFAEYAARHYGVSVVGLTISKEQMALARERCAGLPVEILLQDYSTFTGQYDRVVSIEMIEAVGRKNLCSYFRKIEECLKPNGQLLLQAISAESFNRYSYPALDQFVVWLLQHIFPHGYLPTLRQIMYGSGRSLAPVGIDTLNGDYEKTLEAWLNNFESSWPKLSTNYNDEFRRMWRFYLIGSMAFFKQRKVHVHQVLYIKQA